MSETGKTLKIAHVLRRFTFEEWGGTETVVWNTAKNQKKLGIIPDILCTAALSHPGEEDREGIRIRRFPYRYPYFPMPKECALVLDKKGGNPFSPTLLKTLRKEHYDLIHIHCGGRLAVLCALTAHKLNIPCVITLHGGHAAVPAEELRQMMEPVRRKFHYGGIIDRLLRLRRDPVSEADAAICISREEERLLSQKHPGRKIVYLPNGVACSAFQGPFTVSPRKEWGIPSERRLILCISRIDYQKNQLVLLDLLPHDPGSHLLLIGPPTAPWYHKRILEQTEKLGVSDRLTIIPGLSPDDLRLKAILKEAELFILPSLHEPFGIAALEAWSAGTPLIAARTGGLKDFIEDGRNGLLFDPEAPETLIAAYDRMIREPGLKNSLAAQALKDVRAYSWENLTARLLDLYRELIHERT